MLADSPGTCDSPACLARSSAAIMVRPDMMHCAHMGRWLHMLPQHNKSFGNVGEVPFKSIYGRKGPHREKRCSVDAGDACFPSSIQLLASLRLPFL